MQAQALACEAVSLRVVPVLGVLNPVVLVVQPWGSLFGV
jgi:hypothetical protein